MYVPVVCISISLLQIVLVISELESSKEERVSQVETPDGCPYAYDFNSRLAYKYKRPKLCQALLPDQLQGLPHQASKKPFKLNMEPAEDSDDAYYDIILSVAEGFNETIAGAVIKVQRLKGNGKPGPELPAGHLEGIPPWEPGYCCSKSKFNTLLLFFQNDVNLRKTRMKLRWYPFGFGEGKILLTANVFAETGVYWKIRSLEIKVPIITATTTAGGEE